MVTYPTRMCAMRGKRFSEEQIIGVLKELEAGAKTDDLARRNGVSDATIYKIPNQVRIGGIRHT